VFGSIFHGSSTSSLLEQPSYKDSILLFRLSVIFGSQAKAFYSFFTFLFCFFAKKPIKT